MSSPPRDVGTWQVKLVNHNFWIKGEVFHELKIHGGLRRTPGGNAIIKGADGTMLVAAKGGWALI
jgi:hypothetical protein